MGSIQSNRKMTKAYEMRNLEGWEGDHIMRDKFKQLIKDYEIDAIVGLGTDFSGSKKKFF